MTNGKLRTFAIFLIQAGIIWATIRGAQKSQKSIFHWQKMTPCAKFHFSWAFFWAPYLLSILNLIDYNHFNYSYSYYKRFISYLNRNCPRNPTKIFAQLLFFFNLKDTCSKLRNFVKNFGFFMGKHVNLTVSWLKHTFWGIRFK